MDKEKKNSDTRIVLADFPLDDKGFPRLVIGMSSIEEDFSSGLKVTTTAVVDDADLDGGSGASSGQVFFKEGVLITMDLNRCLHCLSRNSSLKLEVISSSSSQIIGCANRLTPTSALSLEDEENGEDEEDEASDEDKEAGSGVLSL